MFTEETKKKIFSQIISFIAIAFSIFQLLAVYKHIPTMYLRVIHVWFGFILIFFTYPSWGKKKLEKFTLIGILTFILMTIISIYIILNYQRKAFLIGLPPLLIEIILGVFLLLLALDASRRTIGWSFTLIAISTLLYARFGAYLPLLLGHKSYSLSRIVDATFLTMQGIYSSLVGVSATYIYLFVIFGSLLKEVGGGDFFINLALSLTGHVRGGPAKTAVIASSLFGMVSGSGMANVASTGQITIPLMKKTGYKPYFAGAVETVASTGGLIMPPIMGMSIFIMMEILAIPYITIIRSAIPIALLYYFGVFFVVDLEAVKLGLKGLPKGDIPSFKKTLKEGWPFLIPPFILVYMLAVVRTSATMAAFWAIISIPLCTFLKKSTHIDWRQVISGLEKAAYNALPIIGVVSLAGVAMGMISLSGLGLKLTSIIIMLSGGNLLALLILAMISCIIMGMGLPAIAAYIITSVLIVPALTQMGIAPFVAHMFIFYFSCMAGLTPPMAPFAFVAAGIAQAPMMKTAMTAWRLALPIFLLAFAFVYNPSLLLLGSFSNIFITVITSLVSVIAISASLEGYFFIKLPVYQRISLFVSSIILLFPSLYVRLGGLSIFAVIYLFMLKDRKYINTINLPKVSKDKLF
ncbi:hypothetical protein ES707_22580 [subsurface metagenome]